MIGTILLVFAFVLFVLAGLGIPRPEPSRYNLIGAGLAFLAAAMLFSKFPNLP